MNELVLATPMGASVGLLFSAVSTIKPDRVIVLTSQKYMEKAKEACIKGGFNDLSKLHIIIIEDAFCGFNEAKRIVKEMSSFCNNAKDIKLNLTGGTTAMQWAMQALYENIKDNYSVNRIAFVDRRPSVEQQANPYVVGELLNVDELIKE